MGVKVNQADHLANSSSWKKRALITGITGQIGSYLAELLVDKGYEVYGIIRRTSRIEGARQRIDHIKGLNLFYGDLQDSGIIERIVSDIQPDEIYNLAAQSHVWISFHTPEHTSNTNALGVLRILEAARRLKKPVRVYQASTSELYGGVLGNALLNENTPFHPRSPYGVAKLYGYWIIKHYREAYNMFCSNGIVFNTESPRRGENFVTRKITKGVADINAGLSEKIYLGNLNAKRDWSHAKDSAKAMWLILQAEKPDDYVIASGANHSVREFVEIAFKHVGIDIAWRGEGVNEVGYDPQNGKVYVEVDPYYFRPTEVEALVGDANKAKKELGWSQDYKFSDLVKEMMDYDLNLVKGAPQRFDPSVFLPKKSERFRD
ncbi:MAG: GDP-mannose 4,6-dehydratase [archaeon]